ncbi:MAG: XVIPCD domain-containing protein, partial [Sphingobium sp.]
MARIDERWNGHREELEAAARTAGIDVGVMVKIAGFESGFNPGARPIAVSHPENNTVRQFDGTMAVSSAYGYGQFLDGTWQEMINRYGEKYDVAGAADMTRTQANAPELRQDTRLQAAMLAEFTRENIARASQIGGIDEAANVYAMHNLGTGDGPRFLEALRDNPDARVGSVLSDRVISGNPALYGDGSRTIAQAYAAMGEKMNQYEPYAQEAVQGLPSGTLSAGGPTAPVRSPMADGMLVQKEHGQAVKTMQEKLFGLGYTGTDGKPLVADGDFGPSTRQAVEQFQRDQRLTVDGKAGPKTLEALAAAVQAREPATMADTPAAPSMADPGHPDHARYRDTLEKLQTLEQQRAQGGLSALFADRQQMENAAGQVVFESRVSGMNQVDSVVARLDGQGLFAVQGQLGDPASLRVYVGHAQAVGQ